MIYLIVFTLLLFVSYYYDIVNGFQLRPRSNLYISAIFWYCFFFFILISIAGLRDVSIGADTMNYYRDYNESRYLSYIDSSDFEMSRYQPLWVWLVSFTKSVFDDFSALLFIQSLFVNFVLFRFFWKYTKFPFICIAIYYISFYIEFNTEILRESIAVAFCLLAYENYRNRKWIKSIVLWIIAFYFHVSALIALLFPLISKVKYSVKNIVILIIIGCSLLAVFPLLSQYSIAIELFLQNVSPTMADNFVNYNNTDLDDSVNLNYYLRLFIIDFFLPLTALIFLKNKGFNLFGFVALFIILKILTAFSYAFYRFGNYEAPFYIVFIGEVIYALTLSTKRALGLNFVKYIFVILITLYTFQNMQFIHDVEHEYRYERYFPYKSIFD